jgi:hypothetical protein
MRGYANHAELTTQERHRAPDALMIRALIDITFRVCRQPSTVRQRVNQVSTVRKKTDTLAAAVIFTVHVGKPGPALRPGYRSTTGIGSLSSTATLSPTSSPGPPGSLKRSPRWPSRSPLMCPGRPAHSAQVKQVLAAASLDVKGCPSTSHRLPRPVAQTLGGRDRAAQYRAKVAMTRFRYPGAQIPHTWNVANRAQRQTPWRARCREIGGFRRAALQRTESNPTPRPGRTQPGVRVACWWPGGCRDQVGVGARRSRC